MPKRPPESASQKIARGAAALLVLGICAAYFAPRARGAAPDPAAAAPAKSSEPGAPAFADFPALNPRDRAALAAAAPMTVYACACEKAQNVDQEGQGGGEALHYLLRLPRGFKPGTPCNLVVVLHAAGRALGAGVSDFPAATFRPDDIVVYLEGTTRLDNGQRVFAGRQPDVVPFRDAALDLTRVLPSARIILLGQRDAGRFAALFAARFPRVIDGAVMHGAGADEMLPVNGGIQGVPLIFTHAVDDEFVPYSAAIDARDAFVNAGHPAAHLVRIAPSEPSENAAPVVNAPAKAPVVDAEDAVRIPVEPPEAPAQMVRRLQAESDAVEAVIGLTTPTPRVALEAAARLLAAPAQRGGAGPACHLARAVLRRFERPGDQPVTGEEGGAADAKNTPGTGGADAPAAPGPKAFDPSKPVDDEMEPMGTIKVTVPPDAKMPTPPDMSRRFAAATEAERAEAFGLIVAIERAAQPHLALLRAELKAAADLGALKDDTVWLGHLLALREDFRGVDSVEAFVAGLTLDALIEKHREGADVLGAMFAEEKPSDQVYAAVIQQLPLSFLAEGMPPQMPAQMRAWHAEPKSANLTAEQVAAYPVVTRYEHALRAGRVRYAEVMEKYVAPSAAGK